MIIIHAADSVSSLVADNCVRRRFQRHQSHPKGHVDCIE